MIEFEGTVQRNNIDFLVFSTIIDDIKKVVEVPVDRFTSERVMGFLATIIPPAPKITTRNNDEEAE